MKTKHLIYSIFLMAIALTNSAQIKVFTGGNTIVGSTASPITGAKLQVTGNTYFTTTTGTLTPTSAAFIRSTNTWSSQSSPDYSWYNENTGFFHPSPGNIIGITLAGSEKFRFAGGQLLKSGTLPTSASAPDYSWVNDATTGMFNAGSNAIGFSTSGAQKMKLSSAGNLLIGSNTDNTIRLEVTTGNYTAFRTNVSHSGNYGFAQISRVSKALTKGLSVVNTASGNDSVTFYVYGSGDVWAKSLTSWSDVRLKENVDTLQGALNKVLRLKGVKYNFKTEVTGLVNNKTEMGLIAQDVEQVVPEVVNTSDNGVKGIVYQNLVPLLIEAIKEQNKKIDKLETDLNQCCTKKATGTTINNRSTSSTQAEATNVSETSNWLAQNKPNPFNKETVIEYNVVQEGKGSMLVFDMNGKLLKTIAIKIPGKGTVTITANDLPAGMYYYTLVVNDNEVDTKKMILTE